MANKGTAPSGAQGQSSPKAAANAAQRLETIEQAIETISQGLQLVEQNREVLEKLKSPKAVDYTARLNAQFCALRDILEPLKDGLKAKGLEEMPAGWNAATVRGVAYQAIIRRITKVVLDTAAIKEYLGRMLPRYQTDRTEIQISFEVKN